MVVWNLRWAIKIWHVFLNILSGQWLPPFGSIVLFADSLLFETARSATGADALNQGLDDVVYLGLVGHVQLLEASLYLGFCVLWIRLILWLVFPHIAKISFNRARMHNWSVTILLAQLLLKHNGTSQKSATSVIGVPLMAAQLVSAQFQGGPICKVSPGHFRARGKELCILDFWRILSYARCAINFGLITIQMAVRAVLQWVECVLRLAIS